MNIRTAPTTILLAIGLLISSGCEQPKPAASASAGDIGLAKPKTVAPEATPPAETAPTQPDVVSPKPPPAPTPIKPDVVSPEPEPAPAASKLVGDACKTLAERFAAKLPKGATLAVVPFTDENKGVRKLGALASAMLETKLQAAGYRLAERRELNAIVAEHNIHQLNSSEFLKLFKADYLIYGQTVSSASEVVLLARAVRVGAQSGEITRVESASLQAAPLQDWLWYVRRPPQNRTQGQLPPLAVNYELLTPTPAGRTRRLAAGDTVRSGQKFKVRLQANSDCYLYLLLYDSLGKATVLFPHKKIGVSNRARGGVDYEIPEGSKAYWFDENIGTELFYIVASYTPLTELNATLAKMEKAGDQNIALARAARKEIDTVLTRGMSPRSSSDYRPKGFTITDRGVGGVTDTGWTPTDTRKIDNVVTGHATAVKKIALEHR